MNDQGNSTEMLVDSTGATSIPKNASPRINLLWGISSQILLNSVFLTIHAQIDSIVFDNHLWFACLLCSLFHIGCNFLFYRKYIIPTCEYPESSNEINGYRYTRGVDQEDSSPKKRTNKIQTFDVKFGLMLVGLFISNMVRAYVLSYQFQTYILQTLTNIFVTLVLGLITVYFKTKRSPCLYYMRHLHITLVMLRVQSF